MARRDHSALLDGGKAWGTAALLAVGGLLLNLAPFEVFPGIHFVFGGAFALVAAVLLGPVAGGLVGFVAALPTWTLWNQPAPLSAMLYGLEGVWVGFAVRGGRFGVLAGSFSYWLLAGSWLNLLIQVVLFGLPFEIGFIIQCRSVINGLLVAMAVELGILLMRMRRHPRFLAHGRADPPRLRALLTLAVTAVITLPILWITVRDARASARQRVADLEAGVEQELQAIRGEMGALARTYSRGLGLAAEILERRPEADRAFMQELLEIVQARFPEFAGLYVADDEAITQAFVPLYNEQGEYLVGRSYRDRAYYRALRSRRDIVYSGVYQARGGMSDPAVAIGAPVLGDDGELRLFVLGWFDVERSFGRIVHRSEAEGKVVVILDREGRVIADSRMEPGAYETVRSLDLSEEGLGPEAVDGEAVLREPVGEHRDPPALVALEGAYLMSSVEEPVTGSRILIRWSLAPVRTALVRSATVHLLVLIGAVVLALVLTNGVARVVTAPLERLRRSAERLAAGNLSARPAGSRLATLEIESLFGSFSRMGERLERSWSRQEHLLDEVTVTKRELEATFDAMTDAVVITDAEDRVARANRAFHDLVGLGPAGLVGRTLTDVAHSGEDGDCPACAARRAGRSGTWRLRRELGHRHCTFEVCVDQLRSAEGEIVGAVQLIRDVTEKAAAEDRARQDDKLRALGQLAAGVAHNFNNMLTSILGYTQLARSRTDDEEADRSLATVEVASRDAAAMVRRIQRFARSDEQDEALETVSLGSIVRDAVDLTRSRWETDAQASGLRYDVQLLPETDAAIVGSPSALREVFVNLIINALDAMPGGGALRVRTWAEDGMAVAAVRDEGEGMTPAVRDRVFEPFFSTKGPGGHGLGLAMSYGTIQRHDGRIEVASRRGTGTEVRVFLPVHTGGALPGDGAPEGAVGAAAAGRSVSRSVLLVEDEEPVRKLFVALLEREGYEVEATADGETALRRLRSRKYDLVVSDLALPGVDGSVVAEEVRRTAPGTPVVLMTGYGGPDVASRNGRDDRPDVDAWLAKPIDTATFLETVARLL